MITLAFTLAATGVSRPQSLEDSQYPCPVALGAVQWDQNGIFSRFESYIRQDQRSVSATAEKQHGINSRTANSRGIPERTALSWLTNSLKTSTMVVGWNLHFDLDVVRASLIRHKANPATLIRPQLITVNLMQICATVVGNQDDTGAYTAPSLTEALQVMVPDAPINTATLFGQAEACMVLFKAVNAKGLLSDMEQAA